MSGLGKSALPGFTFVESAVSIVLLTVIILGSVQYITVSRSQMAAAAHQYQAWQAITNRFEYALALPYDVLTDSLVEAGTPLSGTETDFYRTTTVSNIDDPTDGSSPADTILPDYLSITVKIAHATSTNFIDSLSLMVTPQRSGG